MSTTTNPSSCINNGVRRFPLLCPHSHRQGVQSGHPALRINLIKENSPDFFHVCYQCFFNFSKFIRNASICGCHRALCGILSIIPSRSLFWRKNGWGGCVKWKQIATVFNCSRFQELFPTSHVRDGFPGSQKCMFYQWVCAQSICSNMFIIH